MGSINCFDCSSANKEENKNTFFFNGIGQLETVSSQNEEIKNKITYSSTINKKDFLDVKSNFEKLLEENGEFILNKTITEIIDEINPLANQIKLKEDIKEELTENHFIAPPIKFQTGEIYKGSWNKNNQRDGFGINISSEGIIFKGLWENDKIGNYGLFYDTAGNYYLGDLYDGKSHGKGEMLIRNKMKYVGDFSDDLPNGYGTLENYEEDSKYKGQIENGTKNGKGVLEFKDGTKYDGDFKNDKFEGYGKLEFPDGRKYEGEFKDHKIKGKGKFTWSDGKMYEGDYDDFMRNGNGKYFWDKDKYYEGQWINNKQHGKGSLHYDGKEIQGTFRYGKIIMGSNSNDFE